MSSAEPSGEAPAESETGLLGGVISRQGHGSIRVKFSDVDWDALVRAGGFLERDEVELLRSCDDNPAAQVATGWEEGRKYVSLLLKVMKKVTSDTRAQHYAVSRAEDILADDPAANSELFCPAPGAPLDTSAWMRVLSSGDAAVQQVACVVLALLVTHLKEDPEPLVLWICGQLSSGRGTSPVVRGAVQAVTVLLRAEGSRPVFAAHGGLGLLNKLLRMQGADSSNSQLLYELCFCLWAMSMCDDARQDFMACGAVPTLAQQVAAAPREKVVRVALAALRHLTEWQMDGFNQEMIACGLPKTLERMQTRLWADPDIAEDVEHLHKCLQRNYRELSTFERYSQEVLSGQLRWGVVHTDKFWREHVRETEADEFFIMKQLIELLKSEDESVVSIACYDVGEFVRFYPSGKAVIKHLGAKEIVMELIEKSKSQEVQRHALQCVSKIMVNNWEFVR